MLGSTAVTLLLLTPAAPVPVGPPAPTPVVDPAKAVEFGSHVYSTAKTVSFKRPGTELPDLAVGAVRGMYEVAGQPVPPELLHALRDAKRNDERIYLIADARTRLANVPALRGVRAFLAAVHGFRHAIDPFSGISVMSDRNNSVSVDMDFNLGIELDGAYGQRVTVYRLEHLIASGKLAPTGLLEPLPRPDALPSPAAFPWRVRRVVPGSPAHKAGMKPGDILTRLNDDAITPADADKLFARLAFPPEAAIDNKTGLAGQARFTFEVRRGTATPVRVDLATEEYTPTNVAGAVLMKSGTWDGMLDPLNRIGYVRVGAVEIQSDKAVGDIVADLTGRGCRGLVLDLRWCPGGYLDQGVNIAAMFLKSESVVARVEFLPNANFPAGEHPTVYKGTWGNPRYTDLPMVVLAGGETLGGGELIAAALQEHGRAVVVGQRSAGRAAAQQPINLDYAGLWFRATYGTTLRPSGKPRHRTPTSAPTDDWGVRPDTGLDVPITPAVAAEVRAMAEEHALRPAGNRTALPFDDPDRDPVRSAALAHLRKRLGPPPPAPAQN